MPRRGDFIIPISYSRAYYASRALDGCDCICAALAAAAGSCWMVVLLLWHVILDDQSGFVCFDSVAAKEF
jgi:hypothetical protein